jgi:hypothetical protein
MLPHALDGLLDEGEELELDELLDELLDEEKAPDGSPDRAKSLSWHRSMLGRWAGLGFVMSTIRSAI